MALNMTAEYSAHLPANPSFMTGSPTWQWSLKSMFGLMSAGGVMAFWLRLAIDPEWTWGRSISLSEGLAIGCLSLWLVQCLASRSLAKTPLGNAPGCELPAAAILLSALDTVRNITAGYMSLCCHLSAERLKKTVEEIANNNAILGYGFVVSCTLGMFIAMPRARESLRLWFPLLAAVVSVNIGLVVGFCNWWGWAMALGRG